ncbi:hypothetical protein LCGC14_0224100 [marine sediment metagenome]|uniref:Uncharacterized protein n=1 Tax=marine sediment metagenome TaxID=412755 RepID=A0A0F9UTN5_9ZZZZ
MNYQEEYYACEKCGQVFHYPTNECGKISISLLGKTTTCNSTYIIKIKKEDIIDMHDVIPFILKTWFKRPFKKEGDES